jgi:hypothetical protein
LMHKKNSKTQSVTWCSPWDDSHPSLQGPLQAERGFLKIHCPYGIDVGPHRGKYYYTTWQGWNQAIQQWENNYVFPFSVVYFDNVLW